MNHALIAVTQRPLGVLVNLESSTFAEVAVETALPLDDVKPAVASALESLGVMKQFRPHYETVFTAPEPIPDHIRPFLGAPPHWKNENTSVWLVSPAR